MTLTRRLHVPMRSLAFAALLGALGTTACAETLRWAGSGDALTLDPHAQNEGVTLTLAHQIYEPLLHRDLDAQIVPALAVSWAPTDDPNVWQFNLREGVTFHNGNPFTADDVVFSLERARRETSGMKELLASVSDARKIDDLTVHVETVGPNPLLPNNLTNLFIMDEEWAIENGIEEPQDFAGGEQTYATHIANGTGPYILVSREPGTKTVLKKYEGYWGLVDFPLQVGEIVFTPMQSAATRLAALLSDEVDFIQDVPVQDLERVAGAEGLKVESAPQNRTIFFGVNVSEAEAGGAKNPFADKRVRQAVNLAIDRDAIRQTVMRGQSQPAGVVMPPFVNGWTRDLDDATDPDIAGARKLLGEAGFKDGFSTTLNCPNDRYVNDEAICQAVVGMLDQIGIKVTLDIRPKAQHLPLILKGETGFYMLGWGVPTFDSEYIFNALVHSPQGPYGSWNGTGFADPEIDAQIESLATETDESARNDKIGEIWARVQDERIYLPIHHQVLNWGMKANIDFDVQPEDQPLIKYLKYRK